MNPISSDPLEPLEPLGSYEEGNGMDQDRHGEVGMPHSGIGGYDMLQGDIAFRARILRSEITTLQIQNETRMILLESEITTLRLESETRMFQLESDITTLRIQNETRMLLLEKPDHDASTPKELAWRPQLRDS